MARHWTSRPAPGQTSITEIARRYHASALALAQTLGLSLSEVLTQHRESVTAIFIECGRCDLRLPTSIRLPPLTVTVPVEATTGHPDTERDEPVSGPDPEPPTNGHAPPVVIPTDAGLPCAGQVIADLKPAQLAMLVSKVATLAHAEGERWIPLLGALQAERQARLARGQRPTVALVPPAEADDDVL